MSKKYGSENRDLQNLLNFENIYFEQLNFKGTALRGKTYKILLREFKDGRLADSTILFEGKESDFFNIKADSLSLVYAFKLADGQLKAQVFGNGFGSRKTYLPLINKADDYALTDFFGEKQRLELNIDVMNAVFAIITPTIRPDGSGSYCEVAQSDISPEKLGSHFKIPHYFVIYIEFL
ncbi:hypothetical protein [Arachidicoccus terrestris]|uniref:hypothetical protein n=1 Tax=Arachidicoccus terrestris TaxID=2875539 RepID=UPI001CC7FFCC|nr:hypothetical protein [Arachidicoccus terrestris]UAY56332.1 hypothetical protein K9M52_04755 [Arachidicoccus terrestris]